MKPVLFILGVIMISTVEGIHHITWMTWEFWVVWGGMIIIYFSGLLPWGRNNDN